MESQVEVFESLRVIENTQAETWKSLLSDIISKAPDISGITALKKIALSRELLPTPVVIFNKTLLLISLRKTGIGRYRIFNDMLMIWSTIK